MKKENNIKILLAPEYADYEMLDTGEGEKLERFGKYLFVRPYEEAVWKKSLNDKEWAKADGRFFTSKVGGKAGWRFYSEIAPRFEMKFKDIKFWASPTPFRHLSFFPEQANHWEFIENKIKEANRPIKFLNLFGYTGVASLAALSAGAEVTHVDASKQSLALAKENENLSNLTGLRIIPDDVLKFLERASKKGEKYDAIIMDPPKFGRGPKGETWKIEEHLPKLLSQVKKVLSDKPLFVIVNSYAIDSSALSLAYALEEVMRDYKGEITAGELCLLEKSNNRAIPLSNTAIWQS
jgi:23S rRNA (cytosine1962-C5)-methyltransferase